MRDPPYARTESKGSDESGLESGDNGLESGKQDGRALFQLIA